MKKSDSQQNDEIDNRTGFNFSLYARDEAYRATFSRKLVGTSSLSDKGSPAYQLDNGHIVRHSLSGTFTWIR